MTKIFQIAFILCFQPFAAADDIKINIRDDVFEDYIAFVDGRDVATIDDFTPESVSRDLVDMVIAQQALIIGGFDQTFDFIPGKLNFRNTKLLEDGLLLLSFDTSWLSDAKALEDSVYLTEAVIRQGEYHAGIYANTNLPTKFTLHR